MSRGGSVWEVESSMCLPRPRSGTRAVSRPTWGYPEGHFPGSITQVVSILSIIVQRAVANMVLHTYTDLPAHSDGTDLPIG